MGGRWHCISIFIFRDLSAIPVGVESGTFELTEEGKLNVELDFDGMWNSDRTRDGWDNGGSTIGLVFGTYEYPSIEQRLTISYEYDGAILNSVDNGFSPLGNNFTIKSSGENYILTAEASGSSFSITNLFGTPSLEETEVDTEALADGNYSLTLIVDLLGQVIFLSDLEEIIGGDNHKALYQGQAYDYKDIDPFATTVARNNEFTNEFSA
ncbi:hypothetical protein N9L89_07800 [Gammaproteobacteria bacterium]|nr:hypothetical protein [Gammaproteobacteria bacterium]